MAPAGRKLLHAPLLAARCPLGQAGEPVVVKDGTQLQRRTQVPAGLSLPCLGLVVAVDRMARTATIDLQRNRVLVTPAQVGVTLARWEQFWSEGTGSLPTGKARSFLADLLALEDTLDSVGL